MVTGTNPLSVLLLLLTAATPPVQHVVDEGISPHSFIGYPKGKHTISLEGKHLIFSFLSFCFFFLVPLKHLAEYCEHGRFI